MSISLKHGDGVPLYVQISAILTQRILSGEWKPGESLPPEPELCREFGVARGTLRQSLSKLEQEGYIRRERGRGTFVDWTGIRPPVREAQTRQIGFVVPYVRDSFVSTILLGVERGASERGLSITFKHVNNDPQQQTEVLDSLAAQGGVAGIVVYPVDSINANAIVHLTRAGYPVVLIDRYLRGVPSDYVMSDHFGGALQATQHLISLGHRRIGFVSWRDPAISIEHRFAGYRQALIEAGLPDDRSLAFEVEAYPSVEPEQLFGFFSRSPRPTAIFAANDQIALAVYRAARRLKIDVPDDLALVGFDNLDFTSHLDVPLTTVAQPTFDIGRVAVEVLWRRINGDAPDWQRVILPTRLVIRRSSGGPIQAMNGRPGSGE